MIELAAIVPAILLLGCSAGLGLLQGLLEPLLLFIRQDRHDLSVGSGANLVHLPLHFGPARVDLSARFVEDGLEFGLLLLRHPQSLGQPALTAVIAAPEEVAVIPFGSLLP